MEFHSANVLDLFVSLPDIKLKKKPERPALRGFYVPAVLLYS